MPVIPATGKLRQEDHEFEVTLDHIARPCLKNKKDNLCFQVEETEPREM
jgi:hypothetical protein